MVTRQASQTANSINNLLQQRDILGLLSVGLGAAGGVLVTQRIANRVLPAVGLSPTPETVVEGVGAAGVKGVVAAAFMFAALRVSGIPQVVLAFLSIGSLTSAGFDLASRFFEAPSLSAIAKKGRSRSVTANQSGSARVVDTNTRDVATGTDSNDFRAPSTGRGGEPVLEATAGSFR
jgi:hypothetical protein